MDGTASKARWGKPALTGRAALVIVVAGFFLLAWPLGLGLGALLALAVVAALLVADIVLAPRPGSIEVKRSFPAMMSLTTMADVSWTVLNPHRRAHVVQFADELAPSLGASARRARVSCARGSSGQGERQIGSHPAGPFHSYRNGRACRGPAWAGGPPVNTPHAQRTARLP